MRSPSPSPSTEYHYYEAQADFINTNEVKDSENHDQNPRRNENMKVNKRYSPFLRMWKHQLPDNNDSSPETSDENDNKVDKRYSPFIFKNPNRYDEQDLNQIFEGLFTYVLITYTFIFNRCTYHTQACTNRSLIITAPLKKHVNFFVFASFLSLRFIMKCS